MNKIVLIAPGAAGKDHLRKRFENKGFKYGVTCTTRPKRESEIHGKDYYFLEQTDFKQKIKENYFLEWTEFRGWFYGTPRISWQLSDIFIMTLSGFKQLTNELQEKSFVIFLDIDENIRRKRLSERNDADIVERRLEADKQDFIDVEKYIDLRIKNEDF